MRVGFVVKPAMTGSAASLWIPSRSAPSAKILIFIPAHLRAAILVDSAFSGTDSDHAHGTGEIVDAVVRNEVGGRHSRSCARPAIGAVDEDRTRSCGRSCRDVDPAVSHHPTGV